MLCVVEKAYHCSLVYLPLGEQPRPPGWTNGCLSPKSVRLWGFYLYNPRDTQHFGLFFDFCLSENALTDLHNNSSGCSASLRPVCVLWVREHNLSTLSFDHAAVTSQAHRLLFCFVRWGGTFDVWTLHALPCGFQAMAWCIVSLHTTQGGGHSNQSRVYRGVV